MAYALDTHAAFRNLTAAGFTTEQAGAIVATVARPDSGLATETDLAVTTADLQAVISALEIRLVTWGIGIAGLHFAALRALG